MKRSSWGKRSFLLSALLAAAGANAEPASSPSVAGATAQAAVGAFDKLFDGPHARHRAVHAKGVLAEGVFLPSAAAADLSVADHFQVAVPVLVRFSDFAGIPSVSSTAAGASPRGMSIKFKLTAGGDTDIVAHSYDGFPASTGEEFVAFLGALASPDATVLTAHLARNPAARAFLDAPKRPPRSYATERYFGVNAFQFTNKAGIARFGRYRLEPLGGTDHLAADELAGRSSNYLSEELADRLRMGRAEFRLLVQLAEPSDDVLNGAKPWPAERPVVDAGLIRLTTLVPDGDGAQRKLLFTPLSLVRGIAPSGDPMLVARSRAYRVSFGRRDDKPDTVVSLGLRGGLSQ